MQVLAKEPTLQITKLSEHIGAEATGVDLTKPVDQKTREQLLRALADHVALVVRDQNFIPQQFAAAAELFGEVMEDQDRRFRLPDVPKVRAVSSRHKDKTGKRVKVGARWHSDHTNQLRPPKFTSLYGVEIPESGGATNIANMRAAYEALPDEIKRRIDGMKTVNVYVGSAAKGASPDRVDAQEEEKPEPVIQPLVRTNPDNGSKALYFHPLKVENVVGMSPEESQVFLQELLEQAIRPEFVYSHKWRKGDMLIWDNRSAMHKASFDYDATNQHRLLYRVLVRGERPY